MVIFFLIFFFWKFHQWYVKKLLVSIWWFLSSATMVKLLFPSEIFGRIIKYLIRARLYHFTGKVRWCHPFLSVLNCGARCLLASHSWTWDLPWSGSYTTLLFHWRKLIPISKRYDSSIANFYPSDYIYIFSSISLFIFTHKT